MNQPSIWGENEGRNTLSLMVPDGGFRNNLQAGGAAVTKSFWGRGRRSGLGFYFFPHFLPFNMSRKKVSTKGMELKPTLNGKEGQKEGDLGFGDKIFFFLFP